MRVELQPLQSDAAQSLAAGVYESLLDAIISGEMDSGFVLSEVALAKKLAVSRTPVHDALRQLAKDGLVEQEAGRRARVASFSHDDVYEVFEIRKYLEGPAAELAAGRMDARHISPLISATDELARTQDQPDWKRRWSQYDEQFHRTIAESSGNRRLAQDIRRYHLLHRGFNKLRADVPTLQGALAEHQKILSALQRRDGAAARAAMVEHIQHWQDHFIHQFPR